MTPIFSWGTDSYLIPYKHKNMTKFINKDGNAEDFVPKKIARAITKAMRSGSGVYHAKIAALIAEEADEKFSKKETVTRAEVDKFVLKELNEYGQNLTANAYERFKTMKEYQMTNDIIDKDVMGIVDGSNEKTISENANKDARMSSTQRDLIAGTVSRSYSERKLMPTHLLHAHNEGLIHIHDTDYMMNHIHNCQLIPIKDMLWNGTVINGKMIERPKSLMTAATVASQISLSVASGQYGGQTISISHLSYYVRVSHEKWLKKYQEELGNVISEEKLNELVDKRLREEVKAAVQTLQFQENTFSSTNGQTPFVSLFLWVNEEPGYEKETAMLIEETLKLRLLGMKNEYGVYVTPSFPKLLYVLDENNVAKDSEYRWLTDLAIKCSAKRMNPDYISAKKMRENYEGNVFPCMGCRSFLAPWKDENGNYKFYGRFNRGVVTLNLVDAALSAKGDLDDFWKILDERLDLVKDALILKDSLLRGTSANVSPIHWRHGAIARLGEHDTIDKYLHNGYSSISLGFIGLYEMCQALIGKSNTTPEGTELCLKVMHKLEDTAKYWKENVDGLEGCSVYSTPSESLCYKFALKTRKRFGKIENVTDRDWFTNSYHVFVEEPIDAFSKLTFESQFQNLSKGGAVSYVELPDMSKNLEGLSQIIEHIYNTITYAEINTRNGGYCAECGYEGGLEITDDGQWVCPQCGCKDKNKLTQSIRVCGYLNASMDINYGKMMDIKHRVQHL